MRLIPTIEVPLLAGHGHRDGRLGRAHLGAINARGTVRQRERWALPHLRGLDVRSGVGGMA